MYADVRLKLTSFLLIQRHAAHQHVRERKEKETESLLYNKDTKETTDQQLKRKDMQVRNY